MCKIRQMGETIDKIRDDHVERYRFALRIHEVHSVLDVGCGVGYGAWLMAQAGRYVTAFDRDAPTIEYAQKHYNGRSPGDERRMVSYEVADMATFKPPRVDMITAFEVIEHVPEALSSFLLIAPARYLVGSVPNEQVVPFAGGGKVNAEHYRHFTPTEIGDAIEACGWRVTHMCGQVGKRGADALVTPGAEKKRTIVFAAERP